jgi:hypothetical protein
VLGLQAKRASDCAHQQAADQRHLVLPAAEGAEEGREKTN